MKKTEKMSLSEFNELRKQGVTTSFDKKKSKRQKRVLGATPDKGSESSKSRFGKYNAKKVTVHNIKFDSIVESQRYVALLEQQRKGKIKDLELQKSFEMVIDGEKICRYIADFSYYTVPDNKYVVEDVKGFKTDVYKIKKKLMKGIFKIEVIEITSKNITMEVT